MIPQRKLIGYALSFTSFIIDSQYSDSIKSVILFGSVARGDFTKQSDIDLFIDTNEEIDEKLHRELELFEQSQVHKIWRQKGVSQEISLKVGKLEEWKLQREVISSGIFLYGKYTQLPSNARPYVLITLQPIMKKKTATQVKIWRTLYGYSQKIGSKKYISAGLVENHKGKKLGKAVFIIPMEERTQILSFLNKHKIQYAIHEIWSDSFTEE